MRVLRFVISGPNKLELSFEVRDTVLDGAGVGFSAVSKRTCPREIPCFLLFPCILESLPPKKLIFRFLMFRLLLRASDRLDLPGREMLLL